MKCYYCQNEVVMEKSKSGGQFHPRISESCNHCTDNSDVYHVSTVVDEEGNYKYVHIYTEEQKYTRLGATNFFNRGIVVPTNTTYHIRLNIKDNSTSVMVYGTTEEILNVPGMSITPANAKAKLKLYLTFS